MMFGFAPSGRNVTVLTGQRSGASNWQAWTRQPSTKLLYMIGVGAGGDAGNGAVGAGGAAAGGGGGGSGSQSILMIPAWLLPNTLYFRLADRSEGALASIGSCTPSTNLQDIFMTLNFGGLGGNASGATGGTGGTAGAVSNIATSPAAAGGITQFLAGQAGAAGAAGAATSLSLPTTGLILTGGAGGSGVVNTNTTIGASVLSRSPSYVSAVLGGKGTAQGGSPTHGDPGSSGVYQYNQFMRPTGGAGGASAATTGAYNGGRGGRGSYGCGGGGGGGAFTGGVAGVGGPGGPAAVFIVEIS